MIFTSYICLSLFVSMLNISKMDHKSSRLTRHAFNICDADLVRRLIFKAKAKFPGNFDSVHTKGKPENTVFNTSFTTMTQFKVSMLVVTNAVLQIFDK